MRLQLPASRLQLPAIAFGVTMLVAALPAQVGRGGSAWLTARGDAQRTSWIRSDALISVPAMSKPGFALQWKAALDNVSRRGYGLGGGVSAPGVTLFIPMQLVTGSSNNLYAIDSDTGYVVWQRHFDAPLPAATDTCPGGTLSAATRIVSVSPAPLTAEPQRGGGGRAVQGYRSVLGQPGEGAPVEVRGGGAGRAGAPPAGGRGPGAASNAAGGPPAGASPAGAPPAGQRGGAPAAGRGQGGGFGRGAGEPPVPGAPPEQFGGGGGLGRPSGVVYAIASDGVLHVMGLQSGKDLQRPAPFVPANSRWSDPIAVGTMLYTSTSGSCGGAPNAVWAIDLESESKPVVSWKSDAPIVGFAFTTKGALIVATARGLAVVDAKTLQGVGSFDAPATDELSTAPTVVTRGDRQFIAVAAKNGHVFLVDTLTIPMKYIDATPVATPTATDSLATWEESTRWVLLPTQSSVVAMKLDETRPSLVAGWTASNLASPATPVIVNGVVFVLEQRPAAILHAYDGKTGKELWSSGKTMTAPASPGSFWSAFGQIYVGTTDGTLYAFGFTDERR